MGRRKPGIPMKFTGAVLLAIRMAAAHHLHEHPDDKEIRETLDALPRPMWEECAHTGVATMTIRIPPARAAAFARTMRIAAANPHQPPGVRGALESRAEKLESASVVDLLGAVEP